MTRREVRRHMLDAVHAAVDPRAFLREQKRRIEKATGISIREGEIEKLIVLKRIPGYDMHLYLQDKSFGFKQPVTMGWAIWGRVIYLPIRRIVETKIEKYGLGGHTPDSELVREHTEMVIKFVKKVTIHEFVHLLHARHIEESRRFTSENISLLKKIETGNFDEEVMRAARNGIAKLPLKELVAIGTTMLVLEEHSVLEGVSDRFRESYDQVDQKLQETNPVQIKSDDLYTIANFFTENRHLIAIRFLIEAGPALGAGLIMQLLERPPTFEELVQPNLYCNSRGNHVFESAHQ